MQQGDCSRRRRFAPTLRPSDARANLLEPGWRRRVELLQSLNSLSDDPHPSSPIQNFAQTASISCSLEALQKRRIAPHTAHASEAFALTGAAELIKWVRLCYDEGLPSPLPPFTRLSIREEARTAAGRGLGKKKNHCIFFFGSFQSPLFLLFLLLLHSYRHACMHMHGPDQN